MNDESKIWSPSPSPLSVFQLCDSGFLDALSSATLTSAPNMPSPRPYVPEQAARAGLEETAAGLMFRGVISRKSATARTRAASHAEFSTLGHRLSNDLAQFSRTIVDR